ncbi:hypothetical protein V2J09_006101 [Rumex salicifolius]
MVYFRCYKEQQTLAAIGNHITRCADDTLYGPYPADGFKKSPPSDCTGIFLPNSTDDNFFVKYQLPDECSRCALDMSGCVDHNTRKLKCPTAKGCFAMIILALLVLYWRHRKLKQGSSNLRSIASFNGTRSNQEEANMNGITLFSYSELKEATHNFDSTRELGEGGFGIVYHGKLRDGREVAVKRLYEKSYKRIQQFNNEIKILTELRHKNLVTLYGRTSNQSRDLLLVYEYIPNLTVADHLHGYHPNSQFITWSTRMNIAIETAEALTYLHYNDIIHRDVKSNNILLDNNFSVKVADFGLSRLFPTDVTHVSTAPQGTPGYLDPEYHQCYHLTDKSDVYSFGVVLVELLSSLPAVDVGRNRHEINLSNYAISRIQVCAFSELVDPKLGFETDSKVRRMTTLVAELAFQCLQHERELRPSMEEVLSALQRIMSLDYDAPETEEMEIRVEKIEATKSLSSSTNSAESGKEKWISRSLKTPSSIIDNDGLRILTISRGQPREYSKTENDDIRLLENAQPLPSPDSVMDKWSSKSTRSDTSSRDSILS